MDFHVCRSPIYRGGSRTPDYLALPEADLFFGAFFFEGGADFLAGVLVGVLAFADALGPKASPQLLVYFFVAPIRMMVTVVLLVVFGHDATAKRGATRAAANPRLNHPQRCRNPGER